MACSCSLIPSLKLASAACTTLSGAGTNYKATVFLPSVLRLGSQAASLGSCRFELASLKGSRREVATSRARRENMTTQASTTAAPADSLHDFVVEDIDGQEVSLSKYKGKVALVVNVASACGLTASNYTELSEVYNKYKDQNFVVLAFPCNQFGGQEPGGPEQIKEFACSRYKAEFPLFSKIDVNGANAAPVYKWLKSKKGGGLMGEGIKWNFGKFLVDQNGKVVERYMPTTSPKSIEKDIQKLIAA